MNRRRLSEVCSIIVPMRDKPKKFVGNDEGIPWCRIEDIEGKFLHCSKSSNNVTYDCIEEMNLRIFPAGTVLCAVTGASIGTYAVTTTELITNQTFAGLVCGEQLYNEYLYYYIKLQTKALINNSVGCAQEYITRDTLENLLIPVFPYEEQIQQVSILKNIDDKISNNNAINAELEALAKTIYDYWFLQFEFPNEEGLPYKSSGGKMVWSEELKREIPEGWEVSSLRGKITLEKGLSYTSKDIESGDGVPMINLACIDRNRDYRDGELKFHSGKIPKKAYLESGDLLIACTDLTRNADIVGSPILVPDDDNIYTYSTDISKLIPSNEHFNKYYLYMTLRTDFYHNYIKKWASGTNVLHLNVDGINWYTTWIPPMNLQNRYANIIKAVHKQKSKTLKENRELAALRDWLLPMLMNGQVGFKDEVTST